MTKNQGNAKQHPEAKLILFENYSRSTSRYHPKITGDILRNKQNDKCVCTHEITQLSIMKMKLKIKTSSHRYDITRPWSRNEHKHDKYKKRLSIWNSIHEKLSNTEAEVKKSLAFIKKACNWTICSQLTINKLERHHCQSWPQKQQNDSEKLTMKTPERCQKGTFIDVFVINFEQISLN